MASIAAAERMHRTLEQVAFTALNSMPGGGMMMTRTLERVLSKGRINMGGKGVNNSGQQCWGG
jgi:hypothetical protein